MNSWPFLHSFFQIFFYWPSRPLLNLSLLNYRWTFTDSYFIFSFAHSHLFDCYVCIHVNLSEFLLKSSSRRRINLLTFFYLNSLLSLFPFLAYHDDDDDFDVWNFCLYEREVVDDFILFHHWTLNARATSTSQMREWMSKENKMKFCCVMKTLICHKYKKEKLQKGIATTFSKNNPREQHTKSTQIFIFTADDFSWIVAGSQSFVRERVKQIYL